jgi:flagellar motor switch protein FliM
MPTVTSSNSAQQHQVLDPCLLGRPVHLLPQFAAQLTDDLAAAMRVAGARRYWEAFELLAAEFVRTPEPGQAGRWLGFSGSAGAMAFSIGRGGLLSILNYRYGRRGQAPGPAPDPATVKVTATEERLAVVLGQQVCGVLNQRIAANLARAGHGAAAIAAAAPIQPRPALAPVPGSWTVGVTLRDIHSGEPLTYWITLDQGLMAAVLQGLAPERLRERATRGAGVPLATTLQVRLDGRLVSKEITLETLFALKLGDIIPVSMGRAQVLLDESPLFSAAVSEHNGTLCLTSFEDTE